MEMNYFKKTGKMMVAACMLAGLPFIPGTVSASELQTQMMSVQMESTTLKELFDLIEEKFNYTFLIRNNQPTHTITFIFISCKEKNSTPNILKSIFLFKKENPKLVKTPVFGGPYNLPLQGERENYAR